MEKKIAVRFYENKKFGSTAGKGIFRRAIFNGTADLFQPCEKYLLDMFMYKDWENSAKSDEEMQILKMAEDLIGTNPKEDLMASYIKRLDFDGSKPQVFGFGLMYLEANQFVLLIKDDEKGVAETWELDVKPCRQSTPGKKIPQLLATNAELVQKLN